MENKNILEESRLLPRDSDQSSITDSPEISKDNAARLESKTPRRVKVYLLQGEDWLDNGTGYCTGEIEKETHKPYFIVRNELDSEDVILKSFLEGSIQYQRQQETLIVWTDSSDRDLALSFQENEGCADLCDFIIKVQQENYSPMISLYYVLSSLHDLLSDCPREITELITGPINYPPEHPNLESLEDIWDVVSQGSNSHYTRACILKFVVDSDYLIKLYNLQAEAEKLHDLQSLHFLSDIVKVLLLYNDQLLMDYFLASENNILALAGILEYDREFPQFKANHRDFLLDKNNFKSVIDIPAPSDPLKMNIFRKDFVLTYLKNVVLARCIDDLALNSLSSMIYSNQIDIVNFLTDPEANDRFLDRLLHLYDDNQADLQRRRDGVRTLHQYVMMTKGQNTVKKLDFLSALVKAGFLKMIRFALEDNSFAIRTIGMELLVTVIEQDVSLVHCTHCEDSAPVDELEPPENNEFHDPEEGHVTDEKLAEQPQLTLSLVTDTSFTLVLCNLLLKDNNPALKIQAYEALRTLLSSASMHEESLLDGGFDRASEFRGHPGGSLHHRFFHTFYKTVASTLFGDFIVLAGEDKEKANAVGKHVIEDPILYQFLGDLLCFCLSEHPLDICRDFFLQKDVLAGVMELLNLDTRITLRLAVLRCFKTAVFLNDDHICQYIVERNLFEQFFGFFRTVLHENNLANSSCLDLLEILTRRAHETNYKILAIHAYNDHKQVLDSIDYVSTGNDLIQMVEDLVHHASDPTATSVDDNDGYRENRSSPILKELDDEDSDGLFKNEGDLSEASDDELTSSKRQIQEDDDSGVIRSDASKEDKKYKRQKARRYLDGTNLHKDGQIKV